MNKIKITFIVIIAAVVGFSSCKKDDNSSSSAVSNIIKQGTWKITLYNDSGTDETNSFTGYVFTFTSTGGVTAVKSASTVNGTWSAGTDDSQLKLYLDFGATAVFNELNDDWHIIEQTSTRIRLEDVSGGGSGTDLLTFEKN